MAKPKNKHWKPSQVISVCENMQGIERLRAEDRALINNQFNGGRPYSAAEQEKYQIQVNVNWLEGSRMLQTAVNQLNNALIFKERFCSFTSRNGPIEKRADFGDIYTNNFNDVLKSGVVGKRTMFLLKSRNSSVGLHGIGPLMWMTDYRWRPRYIPIEDLLIPTDTLCDFSNLPYFAVNLYLTVGEFFDMTHGEKVQKGWDMNMVNAMLDDLTKEDKLGSNQDRGTLFRDEPEKRAEQFKQNRCYWYSDTAPTVKIRMFFYKDPETKVWHRCAVLREPTMSVKANTKDFLYDGQDIEFAKSVEQIMHVQYGDNSLVAPLKYHSVRGLGVMLYAAVECMNRLRCEFTQHVLFQLKTLLKRNSPADRDLPKMLGLSQYSVVEDGWDFVKAQDRYQIDPRLVESAQSQIKQNMQESGASYVQNVEAGQSAQPRTAKEVGVLENEANIAVSNMLQSMYAQEDSFFEEINRRFNDPNSEDDEVKEFQQKCIADGIPKELMVAKNWKTRVERPLGAGNNGIAVQEATALLQLGPQLDPPAQRIVKRKYVTTITRDPAMGELLVSSKKQGESDGTKVAEDIFGTLMLGVPLAPRDGIERTDYIEALIGMAGAVVQQITQTDNMGTPQQVLGLQNVIKHIGDNIQILSADKSMQQKVKLYSDELGQISNLVKGFQQRQQQAAQEKQNQPDPEVISKIQGQEALTKSKIQTSEATTNQKLQHEQQIFEQRMRQEMEEHAIKMQALMAETHAGLITDAAKTGSEIANAKKRAEATPKKSEK